jgi:hypothetical protein
LCHIYFHLVIVFHMHTTLFALSWWYARPSSLACRGRWSLFCPQWARLVRQTVSLRRSLRWVRSGRDKAPSCSRQPGSPCPLPANSTGLPGFVRILHILPRLPPPPPHHLSRSKCEGVFPLPPLLTYAFFPNQNTPLTCYLSGGKDNPPPSVISIVHQHPSSKTMR